MSKRKTLNDVVAELQEIKNILLRAFPPENVPMANPKSLVDVEPVHRNVISSKEVGRR